MRYINFGFSYVGLLYMLMLIVPNVIWAKNKPEDHDKYAKNENRVLLAFERTGEALVSTAVLIFSDFNLKPWSGWTVWLIISFLFMVLYELFWVRYFKSEKTMKDFYKSFLGIPVAGATLPVTAFMLLAVYGKNIILAVSVAILAVGHIGIHLAHKRETEQ